MRLSRLLLLIFSLILISCFLPKSAVAEGTYAQINSPTGSNGSPDAVTWSTGDPIIIDAYGKYIVPVQPNGDTNYKFAYSNDSGSTWTEQGGLTNPGRVTAVYDTVHDKIHVLNSGTSLGVSYRRFNIVRDSSYNITSIVVDSTLTALTMDNLGSCSAYDGGDPVLLFKDNGTDQKLIAFWSVQKTCSGVTVTETRGSMRVLSNDANDGTAGNWAALNGSTDAGGATGPALVAYNKLYGYNGSHAFLQQSAMIRGGSGAKANDIYYFNVDESQVHGFRRLSWNSGSNNWSGTWTSRSLFGGAVNDSQGYNLKSELLSKPIYASGQDKVYVGIARWLDNTNGDTQSLYSVDSSDTMSLASNVYSAGGAHCLYPTFDLMYDSNQNTVNFFYNISGVSSVCGNVYYKTFDGTTLSSAIPFYTVANRSIDIPITYSSRYNDKILLFFRLNNATDAGTPPHDIYFGSVSLNSTTSASSQSVTSPYEATTFSDFTKTCTTLTSAQVMNTSGGEIGIPGSFRDDFETPTTPYTSLFSEWSSGTYSAGTYTPTPNGTLLVYGSGGAYVLGTSAYTRKTLEFRALFTAHNFQHIGWVNGTAFNTYAMFSTGTNGQLNARVEAGGGESSAALGSSYLGSYHVYKIDWGASDTKFYIDGTLVSTINVSPASGNYMMMSNNTTTSGSNLTIDWMRVLNFPSTTGSYLSCALDSGTAGTIWGALTYSSTLPSGTSLTVKTRTSSDNSTWSSYSTALNSGDTVTSSAGRYLQYLIDLTATSTDTPTFDSISLPFASPSPTAAPSSSSSSSSSSNNAPGPSTPLPPSCDALKPQTPRLYAALPYSRTSVILYFTDPGGSYSDLVLEFGPKGKGYIWSGLGIAHKGARTYIVRNLPGEQFDFRIRRGNGCMPGDWSNAITGKTSTRNYSYLSL